MRGLRIVILLVAASLIGAATASPAFADRHRHWHGGGDRGWRGGWHERGWRPHFWGPPGVVVVPPPVIYPSPYAYPYTSPGLNLIFPLHIH